MVKLILIPAAQTDWRAQGRLAGHADLPLNEVGHSQAMADASVIAKLHPAAVHCGPEQATRQTASIIAHELRLRVRSEKALRELDLGHWEGLTTEDFQDRFGKVHRQWRQEPMSVEPPEGEAVSDAAARLTSHVRKTMKRHADHAVALVLGHFAAAILRCELEDRSYEHFWDYVDGEDRHYAFDMAENEEGSSPHPDNDGIQGQRAPQGES
ncbi:MAG TPA: histidine phosphatase family protein [Phycisphaerae bacterium]|nr:histidine phosphatase family protein [Phycisphaerae bacterium]